MTNEEKAREIVFGWSNSVQEDAYEAALEMAKWKDEEISRLKEEISKLKKEIKSLKKANSDASWRYEAEHADDWRKPHEMGQ